jgi:TetR/AcrR family transcriptional regulator
LPRSRDPDRTRRSILDAAGVEICRHGPAGARIDAIAEAAGINKRMLYHYFGNKDGLLAAVFGDRFGSTSERHEVSLSAALIERTRRSAEQPDEIRLLMWEALADTGDDVAGQVERAAAWRDRVDQIGAAQRAGRLAGDVDAAQLALTFAAIAMFPFAFPQLTRLITGLAVTEPGFVAARIEHVAALAALLESKQNDAGKTEPAADAAKPRFRLTANVTESGRTRASGQREMDAKTSK